MTLRAALKLHQLWIVHTETLYSARSDQLLLHQHMRPTDLVICMRIKPERVKMKQFTIPRQTAADMHRQWEGEWIHLQKLPKWKNKSNLLMY
jgi:hypothetical protein